MNVKSKRLLNLITNTSHKAHLLSCAQRCSSKLQMIQGLENFFSMAIQGTQLPISDFFKYIIYIFFFYIKNKLNKSKTNKNILNKARHKTRLTQNKSENT